MIGAPVCFYIKPSLCTMSLCASRGPPARTLSSGTIASKSPVGAYSILLGELHLHHSTYPASPDYLSIVSLSLLSPIPFPGPPGPTDGPPTYEDHHDLWTPYPLALPPVVSHMWCVHKQQTSLSVIMAQVCDIFFGADRDRPLAETARILRDSYETLKNWLRTLPPCLMITDNVPIHILSLQ